MSMAKLCKKPKQEEIETDPDAWEGFDHAVDAAVKSGPEHRTAKQNPMPQKEGPLAAACALLLGQGGEDGVDVLVG